MKKRILLICAVLTAVLVLSGCSSASDRSTVAYDLPMAAEDPQTGGGFAAAPSVSGGVYDDYDMMDVEAEIAYDEEEAIADNVNMLPEEPDMGGETTIDEVAAQPRKIVYNVDISLETVDFDASVNAIPTVVEGMGGFVQNSYIQGANMYDKYYSRSANFTVRVPVDGLDTLLDRLSDGYHVVYVQKYSNDITTSYYDTQARLDSLRIREERLMSMLEEAEELQYLLEIQRELSEVLYQIERYTTNLNRMDNEVNYSTVTIYLQEVSAYEDDSPTNKPVTFSERMEEALGDSWTGFVRFWQDLLLVFIALLPFLPVILVIVAVVVLLRRRRKLKKNASLNPGQTEEKAASGTDNTNEKD